MVARLPKMREADIKLEPYKSQPVLYRAIGGDEYAALITDIREDRECAVVIFSPSGGATNVSRIKYFERRADAAEHKGPACYPAI